MWFGHVQLMFLGNKTNLTQHDLVFISWNYKFYILLGLRAHTKILCHNFFGQ